MNRTTSLRRAAVSVAAAGLIVVACGSAPADNSPDAPAENEGGGNPENQDTVVPPNDIGVGGGEPVDNLNEDVNDPGGDGVGEGGSQTEPVDG